MSSHHYHPSDGLMAAILLFQLALGLQICEQTASQFSEALTQGDEMKIKAF